MAVRKIEDNFQLSHFSGLGRIAYSANRSQYHLHFNLLARSPGIFRVNNSVTSEWRL